jgi:aspartyl-tRNA(Asn)/glutamyl-tRNA(Gln) amidotransferase subunit A
MARTIRDVALGYSLLKGPDGIDGYAIHARGAEPDGGGLAGQPIRVGWVSDAASLPSIPRLPLRSPQPPPNSPISVARWRT